MPCENVVTCTCVSAYLGRDQFLFRRKVLYRWQRICENSLKLSLFFFFAKAFQNILKLSPFFFYFSKAFMFLAIRRAGKGKEKFNFYCCWLNFLNVGIQVSTFKFYDGKNGWMRKYIVCDEGTSNEEVDGRKEGITK